MKETRAGGRSVQNMNCLGVQVQVKRRETGAAAGVAPEQLRLPGGAGAAGALVRAAGHPAAGRHHRHHALQGGWRMLCPWS